MNQLIEALPKVPTQVIADAGYASEENYLFAMGEEQEPLFELLAPYNTYVKEQTKVINRIFRRYKTGPIARKRMSLFVRTIERCYLNAIVNEKIREDTNKTTKFMNARIVQIVR
ncbi:hypothetical protein GDS87_13020 [Lysinibacillus pakistanensis]|uniref:Transposase n=2 Tax=Lysinibacillus pakistanensis TaxID=759811 RepID=A0ABX6DE99_9BACI|nr:hypothetical protein GDS87_13020 [Lysinibacillus pakistanensis]